jgi:GT2 family glycosyltransferase
LISLIICSRKPVISSQLQENIESTIGVEHELVVIDNSEGQYSIFEAYNLGVSKSKYPYLCFMHDDIKYHSQNWGTKVIEHFADVNTGAIGIAGTPYLPQMPGSWWAGGLVYETLMHNIDGALQHSVKRVDDGTSGNNEVVVLDGVWLCIRRSIFDRITFDELNFKGFHFYDMDICMQIHQLGYRLYSVSDVLLQHFYNGTVDTKWIANALIFQKKWKKKLPAFVIKLTEKEKVAIEYKTLGEYIRILLANKTSKLKAYLTGFGQILRFYKVYPFIPALIFKRFTAGK